MPPTGTQLLLNEEKHFLLAEDEVLQDEEEKIEAMFILVLGREYLPKRGGSKPSPRFGASTRHRLWD